MHIEKGFVDTIVPRPLAPVAGFVIRSATSLMNGRAVAEDFMNGIKIADMPPGRPFTHPQSSIGETVFGALDRVSRLPGGRFVTSPSAFALGVFGVHAKERPEDLTSQIRTTVIELTEQMRTHESSWEERSETEVRLKDLLAKLPEGESLETVGLTEDQLNKYYQYH